LSKLRERPVILIQCPPRDEKMDGAKELNQLARSFENSIANQIRNEFPCANVQTYIGIQEAMDRDRIQYNTNELNRVPFNFGHFQDLGSLFNCDVLIVLKAVKYGDKYGFLATTMDPRTGTLAGSNESHGKKTIKLNKPGPLKKQNVTKGLPTLITQSIISKRRVNKTIAIIATKWKMGINSMCLNRIEQI
jgi:hypothetical protein